MYISSTDPVADMLSQIRNAIAVNKPEVSMPHSNLKEAVAKLLVDNKFLDGISVTGDKTNKTLVITINRIDANAKINEINKVSRPGRRFYVNSNEIPKVKQGRGLVIISTSKGLMSGDQAKKEHVGGELICKVY